MEKEVQGLLLLHIQESLKERLDTVTSLLGSAIWAGVESKCESRCVPSLWLEAAPASYPWSFHFQVEDEAIVINTEETLKRRRREETYSSVYLEQGWNPAPSPCPLGGDSGHGHPGFLYEDAETLSSH